MSEPCLQGNLRATVKSTMPSRQNAGKHVFHFGSFAFSNSTTLSAHNYIFVKCMIYCCSLSLFLNLSVHLHVLYRVDDSIEQQWRLQFVADLAICLSLCCFCQICTHSYAHSHLPVWLIIRVGKLSVHYISDYYYY